MTAVEGRALLVMAKAPLPGIAKTRLQARAGLTDERLTALATAFLDDVLAHCRQVADARIVLHVAPAAWAPWFSAFAPGAAVEVQVEGDLGARMAAAFERAFADGARSAVLVGTDAPHMGAAVYRAAFDALARADLVLVPAEDGGYALIGLARPVPGLFDGVAWSAPTTRAETLANARRLGLVVHELEPTFDVDRARDLWRLRTLLRSKPRRAPATARVLAPPGPRAQ